jgi:hypothetical protein
MEFYSTMKKNEILSFLRCNKLGIMRW